MIMVRYLLRKLGVYWIAISVSLSILFVIIDFFSKLQRYAHKDIYKLVVYTFYSGFLTLFNVLPVGLWLALLVFLYELYRRGELEGMLLVGVSPFFLLQIGLFAGLFALSIAFFTQELLLPDFLNIIRDKRNVLVKNSMVNVSLKNWLLVNNNTFAYVDKINVVSGLGEGFLFFNLSNGKLASVLQAKNVTVIRTDNSLANVFLYNAKEFSTATGQSKVIESNFLELPNFLYTLGSHDKRYSFFKAMNLILYKIFFPAYENDQTFVQFSIETLAYYLALLGYPIVMIGLFLLWVKFGMYGWILLLFPYFLFSFNHVLLSVFYSRTLLVLFLFVPYLLLLIGIFFIGVFFLIKKVRSLLIA